MAREREQRLVDALFDKTTQGRLDWKPSIGKDSYILSFPDSSIIISLVPASPGRSIVVEITNIDGQVVDRFRDTDLGPGNALTPGSWTTKLIDIHQGARRTVLKADAILDSILERLEH